MLVLYDLDNKRKESWSPNTIKSKYAIAQKGLDKADYELKWISYPDIRELLQKKGVTAADGPPTSQYTLPAIDHDGKTIMDSLAIALYLDEKFPNTPRLIPEGNLPFYRAFQAFVTMDICKHVFPLLLPRVIAFLDDRGAEYFRRTREESFGPISESIHQDKERVDQIWKAATPGLKTVNQLLEDTPGGPFVMGKTRTYADIHLVSVLEWFKQSGEEIYERTVSIAPNLRTLYEACEDLKSGAA